MDCPAPVIPLLLTAWYLGPGSVPGCPSAAQLDLEQVRDYSIGRGLGSLLGVTLN
ncbi:hypothetical protein DMR_10090 [Solidesulfovibrio magneticus RS-1]|uniref:Uncharacterized protein n=1 Tax=Solidesulfovibrio magneticus (strain ATCC 700980 / DSM 13731 / RS-1) TaxID=573370 RepID=C4XKW1_SOLM1|nr:hypothetical protein DMR_10090 [Solidesulfovibrio magneticus RS-1]